MVVADTGSHRILVYSPVPNAIQPSAVQVIGQSAFTGSVANQGTAANSNTLNTPMGIWTDGTRVIVADQGNNRVLIYNNISTLGATNGSADVVIGQADMVSNKPNQGVTLTPGANTLYAPTGVFYDGTRLFIDDLDNNRILVYNTLPTVNGASADEVIGQGTFTSYKANSGMSGVTSQELSGPKGLWVDSGNLYVADTGNHRVLIYNNGGSGIDSISGNNPAADAVVGQKSFTTNANGCSATQLNGPMGVCAVNCQMYIADTGSERVLVYNQIPTGTANPPAAVVLGQPNMTSYSSSTVVKANSFINPFGIQAVGGVLYVTDQNENRLLAFQCAAGTGASLSVSGVVMNGPTPTGVSGAVMKNVVAGPNISRGGEAVAIQYTLSQAARVTLRIYTMTGELVYEKGAQGSEGANKMAWDVKNQGGQGVASGLYLYVLEAQGANGTVRKIGKILVVH